MANSGEVIDTQNTFETRLLQKMSDIDTKLNRASMHANDLQSLATDFSEFRIYVQDVFQLLKQKISSLSVQVEKMEMRHRNKHLILNGVAETPNENIPVLVSGILAKNLNLDSIASTSFGRVHRLGKASSEKARPILIRFLDQAQRAEVWKRKTQLKGTQYVLAEFLSKERKALFLEARRHFTMRNVWTLNGDVVIKLPNGSRQKIRYREDLDKLVSKFSLAAVDSVITSEKSVDPHSTIPSVQTRSKRTNRK